MNCADCGKPFAGSGQLCETCAAEAELMRQTRQEQIELDAHHDAGLVGIRGWLAFFCISAGILTPSRSIEELNGLGAEFQQEASSGSMLSTILLGTVLALFVLITVSSVAVAAALALRKVWAPRAAKIYLVSVPLVMWCIVLIPTALVRMLGTPVDFDSGMIAETAASTIVSGIWFWYFRVSRRVKMTFPQSNKQTPETSAPPITSF